MPPPVSNTVTQLTALLTSFLLGSMKRITELRRRLCWEPVHRHWLQQAKPAARHRRELHRSLPWTNGPRTTPCLGRLINRSERLCPMQLHCLHKLTIANRVKHPSSLQVRHDRIGNCQRSASYPAMQQRHRRWLHLSAFLPLKAIRLLAIHLCRLF